MIAELRKLARHSGIYGLGIVASKLVGFVMVPVYTRFLQPRDYGVLELLDLMLFLATTFASMGIYGAVFRFYALYPSEKDKKEVVGTALYYSAGCSLFVTLVLAWLAPLIARGLLGSADYGHYVRIVAATFFFSNLCEVPLAYLQARERSVTFVSVSVSRTVLGAASLAIALALLRWGVQGVLFANCLTNAVVGLTLTIVTLRDLPSRLAKEKLKQMLRYGLPLIPGALASFVLTFSDRFFLRHFGTLADVGVYALGYKLAMVVALLTNSPFALTWQWQQFDIAAKENAKELYARIQLYQLLVSLLVGVAVTVLARDALRILTPETYWDGARIVPFIVLCYILDNTRTVILSSILVQRATHYEAWIGAVVTLTDLLLNYVLISRYLAMGAASATLLAYALRLALTYLAAQHVHSVRYDYLRCGLALGSAALIYLLSLLFRLPVASSVGINLLLLGLFGLTTFRILHPDERTLVRKAGSSAAGRVMAVLARSQ
jgi:O-antigen/teichoic acid export membrane protein